MLHILGIQRIILNGLKFVSTVYLDAWILKEQDLYPGCDFI